MLAPRDTFERDLLAALPHLLRFAVSLARNVPDAEDLVQTTVVKALMNRAQFQSGSVMLAWLFTIARNQFIQQKRHDAWSIEDPDEAMAHAMLVAPAPQETRVLARQVVEALDALPPGMGEVVTRAALGDGYEEIADALGTPIGTAKSRLSRGRERLEAML